MQICEVQDRPVKMMDKGYFSNARQYATSVYGGTLSLWVGHGETVGAIVREDNTAGRQSFRFFPTEERAREYFTDRQTSKMA